MYAPGKTVGSLAAEATEATVSAAVAARESRTMMGRWQGSEETRRGRLVKVNDLREQAPM